MVSSKSNGLLSIGDQLKEMRETAGLTLDELAEETKIQKKHLEFLEKEEFDALPPPVYVKGFLRHWVEACNGNSKDVLVQFDRLNALFIQKNMRDRALGLSVPRTFAVTSRHIFIVLGGLLVLGAFAYFAYQYFFLVSRPSLEMFAPKEIEGVVSDQWMRVEGKASNVEHLTVAGQEVYIEKNGRFEKTIPLNIGVNTFRIEGQGRNGQKVEVMRKLVRVE